MRRLRRIKILATLGPASSDSAMIRRLFEAGADVFRINMSHTSHDKMRELVKTIRNVESSYGRPIGILVDLQGPKLRLGSFAEGAIQLHNGESFVLDSDKAPGDNTRVQLPHPEILEASDALRVARGDLGVELPLERVPSLQKQMTRLARRAGKPVVIATQMLESMIQSPVPTRAEVSDVATAVYEGADAIMLSAESAAGKFPATACSTMNRIGEEVERDPTYRGAPKPQRAEPQPPTCAA